ncbi:MAG: Fis family transcriptional regulator [Pseudomonadales bacterium]|nr:Fis family transcriptional regulator [Pseudomonadales bacterium]
MRKTDKKIEKQLSLLLTEVCDIALNNISGFEWLTHQVNFKTLPDSLVITCIFSTLEELEAAKKEKNDLYLAKLIQQKLDTSGIKIKRPDKQIRFDSEEACEKEHGGNWAKRLC